MTAWSARIKSRLPRGTRQLLAVFAALAVVVALATYVPVRIARARWERYVENLRAAGEPVSLADMEALRPVVPQDENGALVIERLADRLSAVAAEEHRDVLFFVPKTKHLSSVTTVDFVSGIPRSAVAPTRAFAEHHRALLDELSVLGRMSRGRLSISYDPGVGNPFDLHWPHLRAWGTAAQFLGAAAAKLVEGDLDATALRVRQVFGISATLDSEFAFIHRLYQVKVNAIGIALVKGTLQAGVPSEHALRLLNESIESRVASPSLRRALQLERAFVLEVGDAIAAGRLSFGQAILEPEVREPSEMPIRANQRMVVELYRPLLDTCDDLPSLLSAASKMELELTGVYSRDRKRAYVLLANFVPSWSQAVRSVMMCRAELCCLQVAVAAERFRLDTGRLPMLIDELVPTYLNMIPSDPFDGNPMRYAETGQGVVIYSVGENLADDGGVLRQSKDTQISADVGFHLIVPEYRGLRFTDEGRGN